MKRNRWLLFSMILVLAFVAGCVVVEGGTGEAKEPEEAVSAAVPEPTAEAEPEVEATPEPTSEPTPEPTPTPEPKNRSQTSGREIPEGTPSRPVILSVENSDGAKPQTGLMQADIIYEFMVESAITRLQVLFNDTYPAFAGPVRSVRYYFVDLAQEWDCMYLHLGGVTLDKPYKRIPRNVISIYPQGSEERRFYGFTGTYNPAKSDMNDMSVTNGYRFRAKDRESPHNLYFLVNRMVQKFYGDHTAQICERFGFMEGIRYNQGEAFGIVSMPYLNAGKPDWIQFRYDAESNRLLRYENGLPFMTLTPSEDGKTVKEEQMSVQNLIIQHTEYGKVPQDYKGRRTCELTGSGKCDYFINGQHVTGSWSRPTLEDYTTYLLDNGELVTLEPGNTWIAVHPTSTQITIR